MTTTCHKVCPRDADSASTSAPNALSIISRNWTADVLFCSAYVPGYMKPSSDFPGGRLRKNPRSGTAVPALVTARKAAPLKATGVLSTAAAICSRRQPARTRIVQGHFALRVKPFPPALLGLFAASDWGALSSTLGEFSPAPGGKKTCWPIDRLLFLRQFAARIA